MAAMRQMCEDYKTTRDRKRARHLAGIIIPTTS